MLGTLKDEKRYAVFVDKIPSREYLDWMFAHF